MSTLAYWCREFRTLGAILLAGAITGLLVLAMTSPAPQLAHRTCGSPRNIAPCLSRAGPVTYRPQR